jgi:hypothetical protein
MDIEFMRLIADRESGFDAVTRGLEASVTCASREIHRLAKSDQQI